MAVAQFAAVGWRARVFWEGDDEWFEGVVTKYAPESGYFVEYDDGEQQWEAEDPATIQFLYHAGAANEDDDETEHTLGVDDGRDGDENQPVAGKWSAQPPPSTVADGDGYDGDEGDDAYGEDEYDDDHEQEHEDEEQGARVGPSAASPKPEEEEDGEERKDDEMACRDDGRQSSATALLGTKLPSSRAAGSNRSLTRDASKLIKSGVFFRDPETLKETKAALLKEARELQAQHELLAAQLAQKEQLSQSLKRELHGLKAQVTVASLRAPPSGSPSHTVPRSAKDWADRVFAQKTANRAMRQRLSELQAQLSQEQSTVQRMEKQKQQLEAKLARVPRKDLCSLVDIQMEITHVMAEKRELEAQLAKLVTAERAKHKTGVAAATAPSTSRSKPTASEDQRDAKTELEKELRQLEKSLLRVSDQVDEWKLSYEKENARIVPVRARIAALQDELHKHASSQVLLRSVFMRLDRTGAGCIPLKTALEAMTLLAPRETHDTGVDEWKARLAPSTPTTLDFAGFTACFHQLFPT